MPETRSGSSSGPPTRLCRLCKDGKSAKKGDLLECFLCREQFHLSCVYKLEDSSGVAKAVQTAMTISTMAIFCSTACKAKCQLKLEMDFSEELSETKESVKGVEKKVQELVEFMGADQTEKDDTGFQIVSRKKRTYASVASTGLQQLMQKAVINAPKVQKDEDLRSRTVVVEGLLKSEDVSDQEQAEELLDSIDCQDVQLEVTERLKTAVKKPPLMKIILKTPADRKKVLKNKRELKNSEKFSKCFVRPSLDLPTRERRTVLRQIAGSWARHEGFQNIKQSPYRVLLNDFTEGYEMRKIDEQGKVDWKAPAINIPAAALETAKQEIDAYRKRIRAENGRGGGSECDFVKTRGHPLKIFVPHCRTKYLQNAFHVRTISIWNSLPTQVVLALSPKIFEKRLDTAVNLKLFCIREY